MLNAIVAGEALLQIRDVLPEAQLKMLRRHYFAPNHTTTASDLAKAVGYEDFRGVNLQYGLLGKRLRNVLNYRGKGQASYVLAKFLPPGTVNNSEWLWVMHPNVAKALEELKWV